MTEPKFTPGPWVVCKDFPTDVVVAPSQECSLATLDCGCGSTGKQRANAHLIAAAPDLYAELQSVVQCLTDIMEGRDWGAIEEYINDAQSALAKARGE